MLIFRRRHLSLGRSEKVVHRHRPSHIDFFLSTFPGFLGRRRRKKGQKIPCETDRRGDNDGCAQTKSHDCAVRWATRESVSRFCLIDPATNCVDQGRRYEDLRMTMALAALWTTTYHRHEDSWRKETTKDSQAYKKQQSCHPATSTLQTQWQDLPTGAFRAKQTFQCLQK